ncbi:MAG: hypothetical protein LBI20_03325 [Holosporales bacterium]|nr:hypothetical protein [Holosporales bacterium]
MSLLRLPIPPQGHVTSQHSRLLDLHASSLFVQNRNIFISIDKLYLQVNYCIIHAYI